MQQRRDSNATLVDESSLRRHRRERTMTVGISEFRHEYDGAVNSVGGSVVQVPKKAFGSGVI